MIAEMLLKDVENDNEPPKKKKQQSINFDIVSSYKTESHMGFDGRKPAFGVCKQQRPKPAYTFVQSDQHPCYSFIGSYQTCYEQNFNFLASLYS